MADNGSYRRLTLARMPDGGFLVIGEGRERFQEDQFCFASTSIDDALAYIKGKIEPIVATGTGG